MKQSDDNRVIPMTSVNSGKTRSVTSNVAYYTDEIVNVIFVGLPGGDWVLIDTGMPGTADRIAAAAKEYFNHSRPPRAILLTHGHFDHVGNVVELATKWKAPVYAHPLEFPFLTGERDYPEPDSSVEGGVLAKLSFLYPHRAIDIREVLKPLPTDGTVPCLPWWSWTHVAGHSPGQVAFFMPGDGLLIAADAFVTVRQDSLYRVLIQKTEVCGPPVYLTTDWEAAYRSVLALTAMEPRIAITGHGTAMQGESLKTGLRNLITHWKESALPAHGKWVRQ